MDNEVPVTRRPRLRKAGRFAIVGAVADVGPECRPLDAIPAHATSQSRSGPWSGALAARFERLCDECRAIAAQCHVFWRMGLSVDSRNDGSSC